MPKLADTSLKKVSQIPDGMPFVQITVELMRSPAWRARSINCIRLIDFLMIRHMQHAGSENGQLVATYDELVDFGIGRRLIHKTIDEAEALRLIDVERGGRRGFTNHLSRFRLTFLPERCVNDMGQVYFGAPTNEWRSVTPDFAAGISGKGPEKFRIDGYDGEPSQYTTVNARSSRT